MREIHFKQIKNADSQKSENPRIIGFFNAPGGTRTPARRGLGIARVELFLGAFFCPQTILAAINHCLFLCGLYWVGADFNEFRDHH